MIMYLNKSIDPLANASKLLLTSLPIRQETRDIITMSIDAASIALKLQELIQANTPEVALIRSTAAKNELNRVVVFPCRIQGEDRVFFRMIGGNISSFCEALRIQLISDHNMQAEPSYIAHMERQYGRVLYERNKTKI